MKLLLDINVVLDVILAREPWTREAAQLLSAVETDEVAGYVAGHTLTTVHYVVRKLHGRTAAVTAVTELLRIVEVIPTERADFLYALTLPTSDFEDAVQAACGIKAEVDHLVTRDASDFRGIPLSVVSPAEVLALLRTRAEPSPP